MMTSSKEEDRNKQQEEALSLYMDAFKMRAEARAKVDHDSFYGIPEYNRERTYAYDCEEDICVWADRVKQARAGKA